MSEINAQSVETGMLRDIADHQIGRLEYSSSIAGDQLVKTSGWLTASLLAINGAGAIAVLNAVDRIANPMIPASLFCTGILFTMLNAVSIQAIMAKLQSSLENLIGFWRLVKIRGNRDETAEADLTKAYRRISRFSWIPPVLGWVAGALFFGGVAAIALNVKSPLAAQSYRCAGLQRDMLASKPKRADSRELFVALSCKEQLLQ